MYSSHASALSEISKIIENDKELKISFDENNIIFDYENIHLNSRIIYGEYLITKSYQIILIVSLH